MHAIYRTPITVHPDRRGARKTQGPNRLIVLHTSEGGETGAAAANLGRFLTQPGDRPNGRGGRYGSSYHALFDVDAVLPAVPYDTVAYSAAGANATGVHGCFPGRANQTRAQWLDEISRRMIRTAAAWIVDVATVERIPIVHLTADRVRSGDAGICDHHAVSLAFRRSTHTDVGEHFPWDVLFDDIETLLQPTEKEADDMTHLVRLWRPKGYANIFAVTPWGARHLGPETYHDLLAQGVNPQIIDATHPQEIAGVLAQSGITRDQLVPL